MYTFESADEASTFFSTLASNLDSCGNRTNTAQVERTPGITAEYGNGGWGAAWMITQKTDQESGTARYRLGVVMSGSRVVYLMANPSAEFDFSDEAWAAVGGRAIERATQLS
ncbi:MAG: hypothetical protein QM708_03155 [Propioniciclava sp.]|uniref:hypothetical protein n=1 Tax=Propioniciclava sp. TaxID=2038686 RepID=UPI0039E6C8CE